MSEHPMPGSGFWYMAGPYSDSHFERYLDHLDAVTLLTKSNITVYSPIAHYHTMAHKYDLPTDANFWREHNFNMIRAANGIILLQLPTWRESEGVRGEIAFSQLISLPTWGLKPPKDLTFEWTRLS